MEYGSLEKYSWLLVLDVLDWSKRHVPFAAVNWNNGYLEPPMNTSLFEIVTIKLVTPTVGVL
jgi:hypothetical protein